jgi:hypothetical protein
METETFRSVRLALAIAAMASLPPAVTAAQDTGIRVTVQGALGTHLGDGGDTESIGVGLAFGERFGVVVNVERSHVPSDVTFYDDGYAASRGATTRFVTGEFRYVPITWKRLSPYVLAGIGRGVSRPNVNAFFPEPVTHDVMLVFPGFGARVRMTDHLSAFADLRIMFQSRRGEPDAGMFGPIRGGLAWRF